MGGSLSLSDGGPRSAGWREHGAPGETRRRKFDFDFRDSDGHGGGRRRAGSEGLEDDRDGLPEWCTDEEDGEMGTFDSSGAFMPMKVCFIWFCARVEKHGHAEFQLCGIYSFVSPLECL